jgi:hypothetical protein
VVFYFGDQREAEMTRKEIAEGKIEALYEEIQDLASDAWQQGSDSSAYLSALATALWRWYEDDMEEAVDAVSEARWDHEQERAQEYADNGADALRERLAQAKKLK